MKFVLICTHKIQQTYLISWDFILNSWQTFHVRSVHGVLSLSILLLRTIRILLYVSCLQLKAMLLLLFHVCSYGLPKRYYWRWWWQFQNGTKKKKGVVLSDYVLDDYYLFLHYTYCLAACMIPKSILEVHFEFLLEELTY